jgi:hypothetical protein
MLKNLFITLSFAIFLIPTSFAGKQKTANKKLISRADRREENKRERFELVAAKEREEIHRRVYKSWTKDEKARDPWTTWHRKTAVPALLKLAKIRKNLFANNLYDNYVTRPQALVPCKEEDLFVRRIDGTCNDMKDSIAGAVWTRMGRNIKPEYAQVDEKNLFYPDPRKISRELLTREKFQPVPFLNLFAVGWIQFMTHDWFSHGENEAEGAYELILEQDDPIRLSTNSDYLIFQRSRVDQTRTEIDKDLGPTFLNENTHWWDGSQIYASDIKRASSLRTFKDGKLRVNKKGLLPNDNLLGVEETGFNRNWWLGLSVLHTLFVQEHNAIAAQLKKDYPNFNDEQIYQKARLINAALMAKIHTVEWTPAILPNTTLERAMNANWKGLANPTYKVRPFFELFKQDVLFGITGGKTENSGVPFHLTEEFTSVYRMHSLLPDDVKILSYKNEREVKATYSLMNTRETKAAKIMNAHDLNDVMFSFGRQHPGALVLNNIPKSMLNVEVPFSGITKTGVIDIGAMDIFRDRERGIPRYNEFRRQIGLKPLSSIDQLTPDKELVKKIKSVYNDDIEAVDTMVGSLAEGYRPVNYGFGETAFQIFVAMASRRLMTDRFYTKSYNAKTYTKTGINWVDDNNFKTVLLRHYPKLEKSLFGVKNAFNPWNDAK